jgi:hypothetical protein
VKLREAPAFGRTIFQHAPASSGAEDYLRLSQEMLARLRREQEQRPGLTLVDSGLSNTGVARE